MSAPSDRRERRRVANLLGAYYRIEGGSQEERIETDTDLDRQGFDAKKFFETTVSSEPLPQLVKRSNDLDAEIKDLDGDMQMLVYENYSKFIHATDVIKQMKFTIEGLEGDLSTLEGNLNRITEHQQGVESKISGHSGQIEALLKQQQVMKKVRIIFDLPKTLRRCLDRGAYGKATQAYCTCAPTLRQYKHMPSFQRVLEEVELLMGQVKTALQRRIRGTELSVEEAVNSSVTLLDLGEDRESVAREYLQGRVAALQKSLASCFDLSDVPEAQVLDIASEPPAEEKKENGEGKEQQEGQEELSQDQKDLQRPESVALRTACSRAAERFVPHLCDSVEGMQRLQEAKAPGTEDEAVGNFVKARVEELCDYISGLLQKKCPPTLVLVSCVHAVRDSLRRLHSLLPKLLTTLFMAFLNRTATSAMQALFRNAEAALVADLVQLHKQCHNCGLDEVLERIAKSEQALIMHGCVAITDCQPLLNLLGTDQQACQGLVTGLHGQLACFFMSFVDACSIYIGQKPQGIQSIMPKLATETKPDLQPIMDLDWCGLFALALVRVGRHLEVKAIAKLWSVAKDLFSAGDASSEAVADPELIKATRTAAQAALTHYVLVSGQRLAHFFRNSVQSRNWMTVREPRDPRLVVEMVLKEVHAFDAQLARVLGDPRKPRGVDQRRIYSRTKNSMELEMERLWAKKLQVFAPIPFNRNGAIVGILRIAIKALYEYVREETFAKFGLQQIQVDAAFLGEMVRDFVEAEEAGALDGLLDEVVASTSQRCVEPVLMDQAVVEGICDQKKARFKFE